MAQERRGREFQAAVACSMTKRSEVGCGKDVGNPGPRRDWKCWGREKIAGQAGGKVGQSVCWTRTPQTVLFTFGELRKASEWWVAAQSCA